MSLGITRAALLRFTIALACITGVAAGAQGGTAWVVADFDGDHKLDLVQINQLAGDRAEPRIQFDSIDSHAFRASSVFSGQRLRARDLDGDADQDLVLETESSVAIAVWLNDGNGHFERAPLEDFHFQLAHEDAGEFHAAVKLCQSELTDESPRGAAVVPPSTKAADRICASVAEAIASSELSSSHFGIGPRGPPFTS